MKSLSRLLCAATCVLLFSCSTTEVINTSGLKADEIKEKRVAARVNAAKQYIAAGNYDRARMHLTRALQEDDKSAEVYEALALVFQYSGEVELAYENYHKALKYSKGSTRINNNYAWFLFQQGEVDKAYELQKEVVEDILYEHRSMALYSLGLMELKLDRLDDAERSFIRAKSASANFAPVYIELADLYFTQKKYQESDAMLNKFRTFTEHTPRSAWLGIRLARLFDNKQLEKSLALMMTNKFSNTNEYLLYKDSLRQKSTP